MSKQYTHLHAMAKTSVKFQNDWPKTVGGVALISQLLMNGRVTERLYRTCVLTQVRQKYEVIDRHTDEGQTLVNKPQHKLTSR